MDADRGERPGDADVDSRITRLHEVATELQAASMEVEVYDAMVDTAVETLGFDACAVGVPVDGWFEEVRVSESAPIEEGTRSFRTDEGVIGRTYQNRESIIVDNAFDNEEAKPGDEAIVSGLSVPLGDKGVFQGYASEVGAFDESDLEVADLLATHATAALDRIERERELKRKNERLEQFASVVSHDLQSPLNVADLRLELAMRECDSEHLEDVALAIDRMETLTGDLLTLAQAGQRVDEVEPVDLAALVRTCWQTVETADATLAVETGRTVRADRNRLQQLLANLVGNAVKHGSTSSRARSDDAVTVTVGGLKNGFYVVDDGPGIPPEEREQVFEHGYTTAEDGTGFGLAIVADIVEAHGWEIDVTESDEGGARFEVTGVESVE